MKNRFAYTLTVILFATFPHFAQASEKQLDSPLFGIKNYQENTPKMVSAGLPSETQFSLLKNSGVSQVIDLIPGDRGDEIAIMKELDLNYYNVQVEWENPTLKNFEDYVAAMQQSQSSKGKTLTHCRLNWRGAVFTYLYRVTQLNEAESIAKQDMLAIWEPNDTWQAFIEQVKARY